MYTHNDLKRDVEALRSMGADVFFAGNTYLGRQIPCIHVGSSMGAQIIIQGAIHAREYITAKLVIEQAFLCLARQNKLQGGIYFVPMVNIDGVKLCQEGIQSVPFEQDRQRLLSINGGEDFTLWKANCNAVDLNVNFDARWGTGIQNVFEPAPANFVGAYPNSECETRALARLTAHIKPDLTISYHARGQVIFWQFYQQGAALLRDRQIGQELAKSTGYTLIDGEGGSAGGYKDYCIEHFNIPAYTIEIVHEAQPFPIDFSVFRAEFEKNKDVPFVALEQARKIRFA